MSTSSIRQDFHHLIDQLDEQGLKVAYNRFLEGLGCSLEQQASEPDFWHGLHPLTQKHIQESLQDAKDGNITPHDDVMAAYRQKYGA